MRQPSDVLFPSTDMREASKSPRPSCRIPATVEALLGRGGMGWSIRPDIQLNRTVAIKMMSPLRMRSQQLKRFMQEVQ